MNIQSRFDQQLCKIHCDSSKFNTSSIFLEPIDQQYNGPIEDCDDDFSHKFDDIEQHFDDDTQEINTSSTSEDTIIHDLNQKSLLKNNELIRMSSILADSSDLDKRAKQYKERMLVGLVRQLNFIKYNFVSNSINHSLAYVPFQIFILPTCMTVNYPKGNDYQLYN